MTTAMVSAQQLALLFELSRAFSSLIELEELLPSIVSRTKEVLQAESCALLLLDEEKQELYFPVTSDLSPEIEDRLREARFPVDQGVAGWVLQQGKPALVLDVTHDERFYATIDKQTGYQYARPALCPPAHPAWHYWRN